VKEATVSPAEAQLEYTRLAAELRKVQQNRDKARKKALAGGPPFTFDDYPTVHLFLEMMKLVRIIEGMPPAVQLQ
jgi:hypothetical protein